MDRSEHFRFHFFFHAMNECRFFLLSRNLGAFHFPDRAITLRRNVYGDLIALYLGLDRRL
ncbi:hypothetical protein D3C84_1231240 [compost metagenome]